MYGGCDAQQGQVYSLDIETPLDEARMTEIIAKGYSRVLVYQGADMLNIRGYLQVLFECL